MSKTLTRTFDLNQIVQMAVKNRAWKLDLSYQNLDSFNHKMLSRLSELEVLNLSHNNLTEIPDVVYRLTSLRKLILSNNQLTSLSEKVSELTNLEWLHVGNNPDIGKLPDLSPLENLSELDISKCGLSKFPKGIETMKKLTILDASQNNIKIIPKSFSQLKSLVRIYMNNNKLSSLPQTLSTLIQLRIIDFSNNSLSTIPPSFSSLVNLWELNLQGNEKLSFPPPEIVEKGVKAILSIIPNNLFTISNDTNLKEKKFVGDGVFKSELGEFFEREIGEDGYVGLDVRVTASRTDVVLKTTAPQKVLGEKGRRIRELTSLVEKRFGFKEGGIELYADRVERRSLSAASQAESIKFKLLAGLPVRRACYGAMRFAMEGGARGIEITVAGKLRGQRARGVKFRDGYMLKAGKPAEDMVDIAVRHIMMKQGMFGVKVRIMQPYDPEGKIGVSVEQPDVITVFPPKEDSKDIGKHAQDLPVISGKN